ncbi:MAG TPA: hypothetical protein VLM41_06285 [Steroidobacteraceae bacterium]|nr:hypothetical protein [Steroidobacteraceae bacterium]
MNTHIAAVPIIAAVLFVAGHALDGHVEARVGDGASAYGAASVGVSAAVRSLPDGHPAVPSGYPALPEGHPPVSSLHPALPHGHPPVPLARPALPEGHPPIPFSHPAVPGGKRALPEGHPRCPARGVVPAGPLERGPGRPVTEPPVLISI